MTSPVESSVNHARRLMHAARTRHDARWRRLPRLRTSLHGASTQGRIFYLCPDNVEPSGGVRMIYRHVDLMNEAGIPAYVLHNRAGFSCSWFAHITPVTSVAEAILTGNDLLVVPEVYGPSLRDLPAGLRVVVNNQNAYKTFEGVGALESYIGAPYREVPGLEGVIVPSHDNAELLRFAFPGLRVERVRCGIDTSVFHPNGTVGRRIGVMPRKRPAQVAQLLHLLAAHGSLNGWEIVTIDNRTEQETAELLAGCSFFLSFSEAEGFGLPPAEAMASGCYVVGFTGMAGREFFLPEFSTPVSDGDVLAFAQAVDELLSECDVEPERARSAGLAAAAHIREHYCIEAQRADLAAFFTSLV